MKRWITTTVLVAACGADARADVPAAVHERVELVPAAPAVVEPRVPLGERLAREAASRPERAVRMEQLIGALAERGVLLSHKRQVLAKPLEASYCETALTAHGLALSLCEFTDSDAAERGLSLSLTMFEALIPGRTLDTRFNALLTVTRPADAAAEHELDVARRTFTSLAPVER